MPDRLLKGSIKRSYEIDSLSWFQEVCFYRLMVTVDDFGCYYADPQLLKSDLFPTKEDLTKAAIAEALDKLEGVGLIQRYEANGKKYLHLCTWENHQRIRNKTKHFPDPPQIAANCGELQPSRACPESKNPRIQESENPRIRESESYIAPAEADAIQHDHDQVLAAAESAGFARNDSTRKLLIDLYAEHGLDKMLGAIQECVKYGVSTIAYLEGVLKGGPKKSKASGRRLPVQQYEQRNYDSEDEEAMNRMLTLAGAG